MKSSAKDRSGAAPLSLFTGLLLVLALGVLWCSPCSTPAGRAVAQGTVRVYLDPPSQTVAAGAVFDVTVRVDAGTQGVAAADVFINFDPTYLAVVEILDGTPLSVLAKNYDNATGRIDIGAGTLSTPATGDFVLATLRLQGRVGTGGLPTELAFSLAQPRVTVVKDESDQNVLGTHANAQVYITGSGPASPTATNTPTPTRTATLGPGQPVTITFDPTTLTVNPGVPFDVAVRIDAGTQGVAAADVFIDFSSAYLSVLEIVDGAQLSIFAKNYDNGAGTIDIGAGTLGAPVTGSFVLVTLHLQGKVGTGSIPTELTFSFASPRVTVVKDEGDQNRLGGHSNGQVYITGPTPTGPAATQTRTPTATRTATTIATNTPTVSPTPQGTPMALWFQNGVSPAPSYSGAQDTFLDWLDDRPLGTSQDMRVRYDGKKRPVVKFDLSQYIPYGSPVVEAKLYLWMWYKINENFLDAYVYGVNRHWEEATATYTSPWLLPGCEAVPDDRDGTPVGTTRLRYINSWVEWDVTSLAQEWVSGLRPNEGVTLIGMSDAYQEVGLRSSQLADREKDHRPKLMVRFYPAPPTPTPTRTGTPTNTPTATPTATSTPHPGGIEGRVWNDLNGNGLMDGGEPGLSGSTLYLYDYDHPEPDPPVQPPVLTATDGSFEFTSVPPGRYRLVARHPPSFVASGPDAVTVLVSTNVTTVVNFGAWVPTSASPTLSPTTYASPTGTIQRPYRANLPVIRKR